MAVDPLVLVDDFQLP